MQNTRIRQGSSFQERDSDRNERLRRGRDRFRDYDDYRARSHNGGHTGRRDDYYGYANSREDYNRDHDEDYRGPSSQGYDYEQRGFYGDSYENGGRGDWNSEPYNRDYRNQFDGRSGGRYRDDNFNNGARTWEQNNSGRMWSQNQNESNRGRYWDRNPDEGQWRRDHNDYARDEDDFRDLRRDLSGRPGYNRDEERERFEPNRNFYNSYNDYYDARDRGRNRDDRDYDDNYGSRFNIERRRLNFNNMSGNNAQGTPGSSEPRRGWR